MKILAEKVANNDQRTPLLVFIIFGGAWAKPTGLSSKDQKQIREIMAHKFTLKMKVLNFLKS